MAQEKFGRYEIISELGRGGMATVYYAYDPHFDREVAVKVLPREFLRFPRARVRFEREAKAIAALEHPAIVAVYDLGEQDGQPYLVMRYMAGNSLAYHIDDHPLSLKEVAPLIVRIASALDEAHSRGIIHRDVKPANIVIDTRGEAYLTDFGLVKLADAATALTTESGMIGTPAYMSPEQVEGDLEPDSRSDIYSLGISIFEMLTGEVPYKAKTPTKLMMKHVLDPVPSILADMPDLPAECEQIITRSLAKNRDDRYATAGELAAALTAVAGGDELPQSPPSFKPQSATPAAIDTEQKHVMRSHKDIVWSLSWSPDSSRLVSGSFDGKVIVWNVANGQEIASLEAVSKSSGVAWALQGHSHGVRSVAWSPNGALIASGMDDGIIILWDAERGVELGTLEGHEQGVRSVAWSPDGELLCSGSDDSAIVLWDIESGSQAATLQGHTRGVHSIAPSPDGEMLASGSYDRKVILWNIASGESVKVLEGHARGVRSIAWSPDGTQLVSAASDGTLALWDARSGDQLATLQEGGESVHCLDWSHDGQRLASGEQDGSVILWDIQAGTRVGELRGHADAVRSVKWSPDGTLLASASDDRLVILWAFKG